MNIFLPRTREMTRASTMKRTTKPEKRLRIGGSHRWRSPAGGDFLARVCVAWEASTAALEAMGTRQVVIRTGLALSTKGGVLPVLAAGPWRRLRSAVRQLPENPTDPELHRIRILAKRARYAAEAVAVIAGPSASAFARAAAKLQTVLGEHQDSVTAQAWLRAARVSGRRAFAAGELIAMEHLAAAEARSRWPKAWKALNRKSLRSWMP